ncbi:hypothetical protein CN689_08845 [Peribacillus butanolivorans]|uniref:Lipoprotein n=1 Tax=Peribacillus butanolivorans TaxID=421767 RepID=A0AAX0S6T8_9BACI|nr:hypothetical protein DTO10_06490 [Peribacillus butanolivorans]PEJ34241.1 hypothetical protein CN689_08845 [Peribacillus butanolivorans]
MLFQKMTVGFLVVCFLAACDEQQIIKKEMIQIQRKQKCKIHPPVISHLTMHRSIWGNICIAIG